MYVCMYVSTAQTSAKYTESAVIYFQQYSPDGAFILTDL